MKYEIEVVNNGYILREINTIKGDEQFDQTCVYESIDEVLQHIGLNEDPGSRYDEKRLYVVRMPGDKNEKFSSAHSEVLWGKDED